IFHFGHNEYVIFTSKGLVTNDMNYHNLQQLQDSIQSCGFLLHLGIGAGFTVYKAEINARKALNRSLSQKKPSIFLVNEQDDIIGPLNSKESIQYSLISSDKTIIALSKQSGLSCESISKIIATCIVRKSKVFDAGEFADCLNISTRSARRILNKLVNVELGRFYAKENHPSGGRPKSLIEVLF
ncbi:MAG: transcriptional regulator, partial [Oscillospiraceae bacterium]